MRALVAAPGSPSGIELREVSDVEPAEDQALVEVHAISLNRGECVALRSAEEGWRPGWDLAGVVRRAAASGDGPSEGARVFGWTNGGAWAELAPALGRHLAEIPDALGFEEVSTLPVAGLTAMGVLGLAGPIPGRRIAITGATGGVGRFAIQLAHDLGAHVTAIVTGPERMPGLRELGADEIEVGLPPAGDTFDLIVESVGGASLAAALTRVSPEGTVVTFGNSSGHTTEFDTRTFYRRGAPVIRGFFLTHELLGGRTGSAELSDLAVRLADGRLRADIGLVSRWEDAGSAIDALLERRVAGKAVLRIR